MGKSKKHKKFFQGDSPHGIVKRVMYKKYLQAYIAKTQNEKFSLRTIIIDGFAGAGRYSNDWPKEIEKYGSPLIALMVVLGYGLKKVRDENKKRKKEHEKDIITTEENNTSEPQEGVRDDLKQAEPDFGWVSLGKSPREELDEMKKLQRGENVNTETRVSMTFIELDRDNYCNLLCNIELLLLKFFQRHFPNIQYNCVQYESGTKFSVTMEPYSFSVQVLNHSFESFEPPHDLIYGDVRSLTFIDPFGFKNTPMEHVKKFAPGEGNEIMINFMSRDVNRFAKVHPEPVSKLYGIYGYEKEVAAAYGIEELKHSKNLHNIPSYKNEVEAVYGIQESDIENDEKLGEFISYVIHARHPDVEEDRIGRGNIQKCTDSYEQFLKRKTDSSYSLVFEVRGQDNCIIYHMVHITNHIRGVEAMKSSMSKCSQKDGEMEMSDYDIVRKGMKLNFKKRENARVVANKLFEKFRGRRDILVQPSAVECNRRGRSARLFGRSMYTKNPSIKEFVLLDTKYRLWKTPLAILQREGKITNVLENGEPQQKKNRFPEVDSVTKEPIETRISFAVEVTETSQSNRVSNKRLSSEEQEKRKLERQKKAEERLRSMEEKERKRIERERQRQEKKQIKEQERNDKKRCREEEKKQKEEKKLRERERAQEAKRRRYSKKPIEEYFTKRTITSATSGKSSLKENSPLVPSKFSKQTQLSDFFTHQKTGALRSLQETVESSDACPDEDSIESPSKRRKIDE